MKKENKDLLREEIKSKVRELANGRILVKGVNGKKRFETYYVSGDEIEKLGYKLVDYLDIEDRVSEINCKSADPTTNDKVLAHYNTKSQIVYFDYVNSYSIRTKGASPTLINNPAFAARVNIRMIVSLAHELIHAKQVQIAHIHNTFYSDPIISLIYRIAYSRKDELKRKDMYKSFYRYFQARVEFALARLFRRH